MEMKNPVPVTNPGASPMFVAGAMIAPGETRIFAADALPPEYCTAPAAPAAAAPGADALLAIAALPVAQMSAGLPALTDEELERLEALEQGKAKPRNGALAAITAERLRRAEARTPGGLDDAPPAGGETESEGGEA